MTEPAEPQAGAPAPVPTRWSTRLWGWSRRYPFQAALQFACLLLLVLQVALLIFFNLTTVEAEKDAGQTSVSVSTTDAQAPTNISIVGAKSSSGSGGKASTAPCCQIDAKLSEMQKQLQDRMDARAAEAQKRMQEEIDHRLAVSEKQLDREEAMLNREITLVGIYAVLAALAAGFSLVTARQDAKEQLKVMKDDTNAAILRLESQAQSRLTDAKNDIRDSVAQTQKKMEEKLQELHNRFPEINALRDRVRLVVNQIRLTLNAKERWIAGAEPGDEEIGRVNERQRQTILLAEMTLMGLSAFALEDSSASRDDLAEIYNGLARFYLYCMGQPAMRSGDGGPEYERAIIYANRSLNVFRDGIFPDKIGILRLRGSIKLARFEVLTPSTSEVEVNFEPCETLLQEAQMDCQDAMTKARDNHIDAGAYFNLALVYCYRNDLDNAIDVSRNLLNRKGEVSAHHRVKYLPDTYRNLSCYLARKAFLKMKANAASSGEGEPGEEVSGLLDEVVNTIIDGIKEFQGDLAKNHSDPNLRQFTAGIQAELREGSDLARIPDPWRAGIEQVLADEEEERKNRLAADRAPKPPQAESPSA